MNFLKLKFGLLSLLIVFTISAFLTSCEKDIIQEEVTKPMKNYTGNDLRIYNFFEDMGLEMTKLEIKDKLVVYGDDGHCANMRWVKNDLIEYLNEQVEFRHRGYFSLHTLSCVDANKVNNINYYFRPSVTIDCGPDWVTAITNAAREWSNLSNCRVNFNLSSEANADITFYSEIDTDNELGELGINAAASALNPIDGKPGRIITISKDHSTATNKKEAIMHEFGHTLGFRHTDDYTLGFHIPGTPVADPNSIMNHNASNGFSEGDKKAIRMFYPNNLSTPILTSIRTLSNGNLEIKVKNPQFSSKPYSWVKIEIVHQNNLISDLSYHSFVPDQYGIDTYTIQSGAGYGPVRVSVSGTNYKRDIESSVASNSSTTLIGEGENNIIVIAEPNYTIPESSGLRMAEGLNGKEVVFKSMNERDSNTEDHNLLYSTNPDDVAGRYLTIESAPDGNYYNPNYKVLGISNYASDDVVFKLHATDNGRYLIEGANGKFADLHVGNSNPNNHQKFIEFYRTYDEAKTKDDCKFQILMHPHRPGHYFIYKMDKGYLTPKGNNPARLKLVNRSQEQEFIMMDAENVQIGTAIDVFNPSNTENQTVFMQAYGFGGDQSSNYLKHDNGYKLITGNEASKGYFTVYKNSDGTHSIKGANGKFLDIYSSGGFIALFNSTDRYCGDCKFSIEKVSGTSDWYNIRHPKTNRVLSYRSGGGLKFISADPGLNERFRIVL